MTTSAKPNWTDDPAYSYLEKYAGEATKPDKPWERNKSEIRNVSSTPAPAPAVPENPAWVAVPIAAPIAAPTLPPSATRLISPHELGEILQVSVSTLYRLCRNGEIPHIRVGRTLRFSRPAIDRWLDEMS